GRGGYGQAEMHAQEEAFAGGIAELLRIDDVAVAVEQPSGNTVHDADAVGAGQCQDIVVHMSFEFNRLKLMPVLRALALDDDFGDGRGMMKAPRVVDQRLRVGPGACMDGADENGVIARVVLMMIAAFEP